MMRICQFAALILGSLALFPLNAQPPQSALDMDRTMVDSRSLRKAGAVHKVVDAFNAIGMQAASLRETMSLDEAVIFDGFMLDIMAALAAIPEIGVKNWNDPETITPQQIRPDRLVQLPADLAGLEKFLSRVRAVSQNQADRRILAVAQRSIGQISDALPTILPIVTATPRRK